ncbi:hypothetical protein FisN_14Lh130 [Fistulifera solaris]|uniref:SMP-30/Gluconolactonase/LRE-like region domain-containing protein n=1 Tax=Fistulifera solaris TaxID=1519565 RepID=A0A1Z5J9E4_FISSO|nr:hypothetical protein FisN_14Lh130 [Fistulifera solaris]|eukprot:GAX10623.1 hypothetical protein FisN_14Lh130 [Fistulifera solaris]
MLTRIPNILHFFVGVLSLPIPVTSGQGLPSPKIYFNASIKDSSIEGIAGDANGSIYLTINRPIGVGSSSESWVYKMKSKTGEIVNSKLITSGRSKVGACSLTSDERMLVVSPFRADREKNVGIHGVSTESLGVVWSNSLARQSNKGVPPLIVPQSKNSTSDTIVYCSMTDGIVVLDPTGRMLWSATDLKTDQVAATDDFLFAVNQATEKGYPLTVHNLTSGVLTGSSGPILGETTNVGLVISPDQQYVYTLRTGDSRGLYRSQADFLFFPAEIVTDQIADASKFSPLISPNGKIIYVANSLNAVTEAYSIPEDRILWRATLCPTIPAILSPDGSSLYSFTCSGDLVRADALTSDFIWRFSNFPGGFIPSSMSLSTNGTRLLLAGSVVSIGATGYAFGFLTDEDQAVVPTDTPESAPIGMPTRTSAPSHQGSETIANASSAMDLSPLATVPAVCMLTLNFMIR